MRKRGRKRGWRARLMWQIRRFKLTRTPPGGMGRDLRSRHSFRLGSLYANEAPRSRGIWSHRRTVRGAVTLRASHALTEFDRWCRGAVASRRSTTATGELWTPDDAQPVDLWSRTQTRAPTRNRKKKKKLRWRETASTDPSTERARTGSLTWTFTCYLYSSLRTCCWYLPYGGRELRLSWWISSSEPFHAAWLRHCCCPGVGLARTRRLTFFFFFFFEALFYWKRQYGRVLTWLLQKNAPEGAPSLSSPVTSNVVFLKWKHHLFT